MLPSTFIFYFLIAWLAAVAGIVGFKLLTGGINTSGLLGNERDGPYSPERIQLLVITVASVVVFVHNSIADLEFMDPAKGVMLTGVAGSQVLYLAGKLVRNINGKAT
jgi:hypothetical protein